MKIMRNLCRSLACLAVCTLAACNTIPDNEYIEAYLNDVRGLRSEQNSERIRNELAVAVSDPRQSYAFSDAVWSEAPRAPSPEFNGGGFFNKRVSRDTFRNGGALDVTVQFDMRPGIPIYRVILEPLDFEPDVMDNWREYLVLHAGLNQDSNSDEKIVAPIAGSERTKDGKLITPWVSCPSCIADGPETGDDAQRARLLEYAKSYGRQSVDTSWPGTAKGFRKLYFKDRAPADLVAGSQSIQAAREVARSAEQSVRKIAASEAASAKDNQAYSRFFRDLYRPLSFAGFAKRSDCPESYEIVSIYGSSSRDHARGAREIERYAQCQVRLLEEYDLAGYISKYPGIVKQERALWAKTFNMKRRKILTPKQQTEVAKRRIQTAYEDADNSWDRADRVAADTAKRRADQARARQVFIQNQATINNWQRSVARNGGTNQPNESPSANAQVPASGSTSSSAGKNSSGGTSANRGQITLTFTPGPARQEIKPQEPLRNSEYKQEDMSIPRPNSKKGPSCSGCVVPH